MADEVIEHKCSFGFHECRLTAKTFTTKKLKCSYSFFNYKSEWKFDWSALKAQGIDGVKGHIVLPDCKIDVDLKELDNTISAFSNSRYSSFELFLTLQKSIKFAQSANTDAVLLVEETKLHVNKAFLSYHSEFFGGLFAFKSEEKQNEEFKINGVTADDIKALLAIIHPGNDFPTDSNAEKLLELADRFMIPFVTSSVENHLLKSTKIDHPTLVWLADKYRLKKLMKHAISLIDSIDTVRKLRSSPNFAQMSSESCRMLVDCLLQIKSRPPNYIYIYSKRRNKAEKCRMITGRNNLNNLNDPANQK